MLPEAPSFDDILRALLEGAARWLFGSGVIGTAVVTLITLVFVVKTYVDLFNEARRRLPGPLRAVRAMSARAVEVVRGLRLPAALAASIVTIVLFLAQAGWLWGARWQGAMLGELWNIVAWGSWEVHDGTYYAVWCIVLLILAWAGTIAGRRGGFMAVPAVAVPLLMVGVSALFLVIATIIGVLVVAMDWSDWVVTARTPGGWLACTWSTSCCSAATRWSVP